MKYMRQTKGFTWTDYKTNPKIAKVVRPRMGSYEPIRGRTTCQPDLTTFLQPRHIPTQGYNITQSSAPDDGHMVARNMLSNY